MIIIQCLSMTVMRPSQGTRVTAVEIKDITPPENGQRPR
jgi:hypothetical protein